MSESALAEAARKVADNPEVKLALQAVVDLAMANCGCEGASVTLVGANGGAEIERRVQQLDREGRRSAVRATTRDRAYGLPRTAAPSDPGHPHRPGGSGWGPDVANLGLNSVLSIHLFTDHRILGALNLYYEARDDFTIGRGRGGQSGRCTCFGGTGQAPVGAGPVAGHRLPTPDRPGAGHLMERFRLGPEKAFSVLRRTHSSTTSSCTRSPGRIDPDGQTARRTHSVLPTIC